MNKKALIGLFVVSLIVAGYFLLKKKSSNEKEIKIGLISVFSGDGANYGESARSAVDLAVDEINATGGIEGRKIKIIYEDDKGQAKDAISAFQKLASVDKVPVVIGPFYSGNVLACAPHANKSKVVMMSGSATSDNITSAGDFVFRTCPTNLEQGKTIADFCFTSLKKNKAFIIYRNADYGVTLKDRFKDEFTKLGGVITGEEAIEPDTRDAKPVLLKAKVSKTNLVFIPVHYPEGGVILKQAKEMGMNAIFIGGDGGYDPKLIEIAGGAAEGSYWATIGWGGETGIETTNSFMQKYKAKYGKEPGVYSGLYYDAMNIIAEVMKGISEKDLSGKALQEGLFKIKDYKGATGITTFTKDGDVEKPFSIYQVVENNFVLTK